MNPEKILIFDTENIISNRVESLLIKFGYKQNHFVDNFQEGENLLKRITFDLIICKISFPLEDTVLFLERVLKNIETPVVYIVDEGKESLYKKDKLPNHHLFLIFPFNPLTFRSVLEIYFKSLKEKRLKEVFIIRKNKTQIEIPFDQIFWINSEKNYCSIYTKNKIHLLRTTIKKMVEIVPENLFVQVHRSSIINFREIEKLSVKDKKVIVNGHEIGIGRNYKKDLIERLKII